MIKLFNNMERDKKSRNFIKTTIREFLNEETLSLSDKLDIERAERQIKELSFNVLPKQKETVKKFLIKGYYNFEESNGVIFLYWWVVGFF
jgi:hypothetical protein